MGAVGRAIWLLCKRSGLYRRSVLPWNYNALVSTTAIRNGWKAAIAVLQDGVNGLIAGEIVLPDHYVTLGIAPGSRPAAIRAAYVELMRRYHPDLDSSAGGAVRVRAITAAYAVLGVPDRRAAYDLKRARRVAAEGSALMPERPQWRPFLAAAFGLLLIALVLPLLISPPLVPPERSGPTSSVGGRQQAVPLEQDQTVTSWTPGAFEAAEGATDIFSLSEEAPIVTPLTGVAQMPLQATGQHNTPAAPEKAARYERAIVVEQMVSAAQPPEAIEARAQAIRPRPKPPQRTALARHGGPAAGADQAPAWQQPIKPAWQQPIKSAWQRPLPPSND